MEDRPANAYPRGAQGESEEAWFMEPLPQQSPLP